MIISKKNVENAQQKQEKMVEHLLWSLQLLVTSAPGYRCCFKAAYQDE